MEQYFEHSTFDINWADYQNMFPGETKIQIVNRMGEIIMIQSLLEEVLKKKKPLILDTFWKNLFSEKQWIGKWENFRDQKVAVTRNRKNKKVEEKIEDDDDEDDERQDDGDEKEEDEVDEIEEVRMNADDERDEDFEMEDIHSKEVKLESKEAFAIGKLYTKLKQVLETHFKSQQIGISLDLDLEEEVEKKEMSSEVSQKLLEKIARTVYNSPNEMEDRFKIEKLEIIKTLDSLAFGMASCDNAEINKILQLECDRKESISLDVLAELVIALLDE